MYFQSYLDPIITAYNLDQYGNRILLNITNEPHMVVRNKFAINQLPDKQNKVTIDGMYEIKFDKEITDPLNFKVDYLMGVVYFHPDKNGETIQVSYKGVGVYYFPAKRVYTSVSEHGDVEATLEDYVETIRTYWYQGLYDDEQLYLTNNQVYYDGSTYICTKQTLGNPPTDTEYWRILGAGLSDKKDFDEHTQYYHRDVVFYDEQKAFYICKEEPAIGTLPTDTEYWDLMISFKDIYDAEAQRIINENERIIAENERVISEDSRVIAEDDRVIAEGDRVIAENDRVIAEDSRVIAENDRVVVEGDRVIAENDRVIAEDSRVIAEGARDTAEDIRIINEDQRIIDENIRISNEEDRENDYYNVLKPDILEATENANAYIYRKEFNPEEIYYKNNFVTYNNFLYVCIQDTVIGSTPIGSTPISVTPEDEEYWYLVTKTLNWLEEYVSITLYEPLDAVFFNGSSYICIQETLDNEPTNEDYWTLLSQKGDKGDKGDKGAALSYKKGGYDEQKQYYENDLVTYNNNGYACIQDSLGNDPTNEDYWEIFFQGGDIKTVRYLNNTIIISDSSTVNINIPEYDKKNDMIMVFKNSVYLHENLDYTISLDGSYIEKVPSGTTPIETEWDAETEFNFIVFKNIYTSEEDPGVYWEEF